MLIDLKEKMRDQRNNLMKNLTISIWVHVDYHEDIIDELQSLDLIHNIEDHEVPETFAVFSKPPQDLPYVQLNLSPSLYRKFMRSNGSKLNN